MLTRPDFARPSAAATSPYVESYSTRLGNTRRLLVASLAAVAFLSFMVLSVVFCTAGYLNDTIAELERVRAQNALGYLFEKGGTVDAAALNRLALEQGLKGVHLADLDEIDPTETTLPLLDGSGRALAWTSRKLGSEVFTTLAPLRIGGTLIFLVMMALLLRRLYMIASELEARRRDAHELARRDQLTGLGNRLAFDEAMASGLAGSRRVGVLSLDLDDFKRVNDTMGHGAGDELLQLIAGRLRAAAKPDDVVARIGGDEFTLIRVGVATRADLDELARDIETALGAPFAIGSHALDVHASIGMALAPEDGMDPQTLMRHADLALYGAKRSGRQGSHVDRLRAVG